MASATPSPNHTPPHRGRDVSLSDRWIAGADQALRTILGVHSNRRPNPGDAFAESVTEQGARRHATALMRVNHAGEVAAQALYAGQALTATNAATQTSMLEAAQEEADHLAWCAQRIAQLDGRTSILNPLWYAGSFAIGAVAGFAGDHLSLGFVAETEKQVGKHLQSHLQQLPSNDLRTRAIIEKMSEDEARHGENAVKAGAKELPTSIRTLMSYTSKLMTRSSYWL
jgi:3-demethoxyubiquinol 3-hydroxylase